MKLGSLIGRDLGTFVKLVADIPNRMKPGEDPLAPRLGSALLGVRSRGAGWRRKLRQPLVFQGVESL